MPPSPVYNWLAVVHSALVIALECRAAQVIRVGSVRASQGPQPGTRGGVHEKTQEEVKNVEEIVLSTADEPLSSEPTRVQPSSLLHANEAWLRQLEIAATPRTSLLETVSEPRVRDDTTVASTLQPSSTSTTILSTAAARPPAAEPLNLSIPDAPPSQHLPIPESDAPQDDVLLIGRLYFLHILKLVLL
jgi:hypothetical protein